MDLSPVSALLALLPPGLAVGPSLSCGGALGLWWVGLPLEAGSELPTGRSLDQDSTNHTESTGSEKVPALPHFLRFACRAQSSSQQNLSLQTQLWPDLGSRKIQVRTTKSVHTGAELLLPRPRAAAAGAASKVSGGCEKAEQSQTPEEKSTQTAVNSSPNESQSSVPVLSDSEPEEEEEGDKMAATETETAPPSVWAVLDSLCRPAARKPTARKTGEEEGQPCGTSDEKVAVATVRRHRQRPWRYPCETCGRKFQQKYHLDKHRFTHSQSKEFSCDQCGKAYSNKASFIAHQLLHAGKRPFPCPLCPKAYGLKRDLKEHLVLHSGLRPFSCSDCGRGFTRGPSLKVHQQIHCEKRPGANAVKVQVQVQVQCSVCSRTFSNADSLQNHMKNHKRKHCCDQCGKRFKLKAKLLAHTRTHSEEDQAQSLSCAPCGRSFSCWQERQRHLQEHKGKSACLCSVCGKELKDMKNLRKHEQLHTDQRSHPCPHCDKGYVSSSKLRVHLRSAHSSEKPFVCHCGAAYALRQCLIRHQALNHGPDRDQDRDPPQRQQQPITEQGRGEGAEPEQPPETQGRDAEARTVPN